LSTQDIYYNYPGCNDISSVDYESESSWRVKLHEHLSRIFSRNNFDCSESISSGVSPEESGYGSRIYRISTELSLVILTKCYGINIPDIAGVKDYMDRHPGIGDAVLYAGILISEEFSEGFKDSDSPEKKGPEISLELYKDPDGFDSYLILYLRRDNYDDDVADRLDKIFDECEPALGSVSGWLYITADFRSSKG
jgi:hypothetical protein